jgi:dolichol-phosphate mannosyltransferase
MDADLQHDESLLPTMLSRLRQEPLDVVVASRYCQGGSVGRWDEPRARMSRWATALARATLRVRLTDPMSGFFMLRREVFHESVRRLSGQGYKILLDLFASARQRLRFAELPYTFRERSAGESKLDAAVAWEYVLLLIDKTIGRWIPTRFVMFSLVGTLGLLVHFSALSAGYKLIGLDFSWAQTLATLTAMTCNFALNNRFTYRDRRLRGWRWLTGLLSFYLVCGLGVLGNVGIAVALFDRQEDWLLAGAAGAVVGTVWNFVASSAITWRQR